MLICPDCGYENIPGVDQCEQCQQSLTGLSKPQPATALERSIFKDRIEVLNPRKPLVVAPDTPIGEVLDLLVDQTVGCALVVDGEDLVGIFSERDALNKLNTDAKSLKGRPVDQFMTKSPETLEIKDKIAFALHKMALGGYRHIPILSAGQVVGVISVRDILRYATERLSTVNA